MTQIAFILLCHKEPDRIIAQARQLTATGDCVAIHFDRRAGRAPFRKIQAALAGNPNVCFARREACGWGEWSLVQATLNGISAALQAFPRATHFYLVSGDCQAIKSSAFAHDFLERDDCDYIECKDFHTGNWIKTGLKQERLIYRHFFNERARPWLFYRSYELQKWLGLTREIPQGLRMCIGSQWWCLRRRTVETVIELTQSRRDIVRFFRTTWIPDETFFQTMVRHVVPAEQIRDRTPTFLLFSDYGMPVTFYNDHHDMLLAQNYLFARKISPEADDLRQRLSALWASPDATFTITDEGPRLFRFLTTRGRVGARTTPRMWETGGQIGPSQELMVVVSKKWHVAKRLAEMIRNRTALPSLDYVFDEADTSMPDLGGLETTLAKRTRHRRSLLRLLFRHYQSDQLLVCLDPSSFDLIEDVRRGGGKVRVLLLDCEFSNDYLIGHARRVGLADEHSAQVVMDQLLPAIRNDIDRECDAIRQTLRDDLFQLSADQPPEVWANTLAEFLQLPLDTARQVACLPHLFSD